MKASRLLVIVFLCFSLHCVAQQANVWAFGLYGGLTFNTNPPSSFLSKIAAYGGLKSNGDTQFVWVVNSSSICDCKGNLLFYTSGQSAWNRYGNYMPHGFRKRCFDSLYVNGYTNTCYILKKPGDSFTYYIIYGTSASGHPKQCTGLFYYTVDLRLDSGRGDATSSYDSTLYNYHYECQYLSAVKQANGKDWWLLSLYGSDTLYAYPVTANGIGSPIVSYIHFEISSDLGVLKTSHKGDKLLFSGFYPQSFTNYTATLIDFDTKTGKTSNQTWLWDNVNVSSQQKYRAYGAEFSANDSLLYLATSNPYTYKYDLAQYLTYANNPDSTVDIVSSFSGTSGTFSLQIAPDDKIYSSLDGAQYLGEIKYPDRRGVACTFEQNVISLDSSSSAGANMPSIFVPLHPIQWRARPAVCSDTVYFDDYSDTVYFHNFIWAFGDGDSATGINAKHHYARSGKYLLTVAAINSCGSYAYASDTVIARLPVRSAGFVQDSVHIACGSSSVYLHGTATSTDSAVYYRYSFSDGSPGIITNSLAGVSHTFTKSGTYKVIQTATNGYCQDTASLTLKINIEPRPVASFSTTDTVGCSVFSVLLNNTSKNAFHYKWLYDDGTTDTSTAPLDNFADTGYQTIKLVAYNHQGCADTVTHKNIVHVVASPKPSFTYTIYPRCTSDSLAFTNTSTHATHYFWSFNDTNANTSHVYTIGGTYHIYLAARNKYCTDTVRQDIPVTLHSQPTASISFTGKTTYCQGDTFSLPLTANSGTDYTYQWKEDTTLLASTAQTDTATIAGSYTVRITDSLGCQATSAPLTIKSIAPPSKPQIIVHGSNLLSSSSYNNQWYLNDTLIPGATAQKYTENAPGSYTVTVTDTDGCSATSNPYVVTGILPVAIGARSLTIYPNPSHNTFHIQLQGENISVSVVSLTDILGHTIATFSTGKKEFEIDATAYGLQKGMYILTIHSGSEVFNAKLVVE